VFVTGNANKLAEVKTIIETHLPSVRLVSESIDLPELQGEPEEISLEKCKIASKALGNRAVIVEDTCLCFNALKGLPGPYIKWFLDKLGHDGLNTLLHGWEDKTAYALCTFSYQESPESEAKVFVGKTHGKIVPARGPKNFGWDPIFEPDGFGKTFAEMDSETKNSISHRRRALDGLIQYLTQESHTPSQKRNAEQEEETKEGDGTTRKRQKRSK